MASPHDTSTPEEDVVVIEERDKRTQLYIGLAATLGLVFGGLIGSSYTASQWESTYTVLESQYQALSKDKQNLIHQVNNRQVELDSEVEDKLRERIADQKAEFEQAIAELEQQVVAIEKVNLSLESQVKDQLDIINKSKSENQKLNQQADMQASIFERSRDVFRRELQVSQELEQLHKEREELLPKIATFDKQCKLYLEGTSWDATADSCDKHDAANSRLSQVDQMIEVYKLDLKQIQQITEDMCL